MPFQPEVPALELSERIVMALGEGAKDVGQLASAAHAFPSAVRDALDELVAKRRVTGWGDGVFSLPLPLQARWQPAQPVAYPALGGVSDD